MKTTLEALEGNKIKLSIEVDEIEFDRYLDGAFRKISTQVRIPGFRQGKAPRKLIEAQIGVEAARSQAIEDAIPASLALAVREHDLDIIATPEVNLTGGQESGNIAFDATCEVRPVVEIAGYKKLKVEMPSLVASDDDIDEVVKYERKRHATLSDVDRPAKVDDQVTLDLVGSRNGEPLPGLNVEDWLYEIGRNWVAEDFDKQLTGATTGQKTRVHLVAIGYDRNGRFRRHDQKDSRAGVARTHRRVGCRTSRRARNDRSLEVSGANSYRRVAIESSAQHRGRKDNGCSRSTSRN